MRAFSARDRNFVSLLIELIFTVAVNFTAGMFCSMFIFVFRLPWLLASYQPSWVSFPANSNFSVLNDATVQMTGATVTTVLLFDLCPCMLSMLLLCPQDS